MQQPTDATIAALDLGATPDPGDTQPTIMATDTMTLVGFNALKSDGRPCLAIAEFANCLIAQFGYPNDEALTGHALYAHGLNFYGIYEVSNSPWLASVNEMNRQSFPTHPGYHARHFVVTMNDNTFEALADRIDLSLFEDMDQRALRVRMAERLTSS